MAKNRYYNSSLTHHTPDGFCNTEPLTIKRQDVRKWSLDRFKNKYPHAPKAGYDDFFATWWQEADFSDLTDGVWWLGHSTSLIRVNNITILTDPVFSYRASPVRFLGPKRRTPAAAKVEQLPHIDAIVISHDHYDHLDYPSIKKLLARFPDVQFFVPLGMKAWCLKQGVKNVIELDWWQNTEFKQIEFTFVPARHWTQRSLFSKNRVLWGGWFIRSPQQTVYFMGDTGYSPTLQTISQRLGPIDIALIPIGAYAPRWFMKNQHIDPYEAVQLFQELQCKKAIAIHWGAFELADEPIDEPPELLTQALEKQKLTNELFLLLKIGGKYSIDDKN
ncbi:MBL fold metallo-hydrolase [Zophobihabitans entericus]|uniref:MBL fold metallo-hydrolase n=1 Tax=Zophobihabitans entericus TaxID=1635327 RepID=A0A6G9IBS1_9GAMM|nr:MBL fold metallo-hydrolase [Zophobihabitans entericus]QIQ21030.1 MBL fold metallo-hydrolase [Zophobihabitans entericus]